MKIHAPRKGSLQFAKRRARTLIPAGNIKSSYVWGIKAGMFHSLVKSTNTVIPITAIDLLPLEKVKTQNNLDLVKLKFDTVKKDQKKPLLRTIKTSEEDLFTILSSKQNVDITAITKGKGFNGPVKRSGIKLAKRKGKRANKLRHVGCVGPRTPSRVNWTTPQAGQLGYTQRTHYNIKVIRKEDIMTDLNIDFPHYGKVTDNVLFVKGSIPGAIKRTVRIKIC